MTKLLQRIRAWLRRRRGSGGPNEIDSAKQDAMAGMGIPGVADVPPNYVPPADEGRPRH